MAKNDYSDSYMEISCKKLDNDSGPSNSIFMSMKIVVFCCCLENADQSTKYPKKF